MAIEYDSTLLLVKPKIDPAKADRRGHRQRQFRQLAIIKQLYPDQETYKKEEQRRFESLNAR